MSRTIELEQRMQAVIDSGAYDMESEHMEADAILVEAARSAGFDTLCDLYERVPKWYA